MRMGNVVDASYVVAQGLDVKNVPFCVDGKLATHLWTMLTIRTSLVHSFVFSFLLRQESDSVARGPQTHSSPPASLCQPACFPDISICWI